MDTFFVYLKKSLVASVFVMFAMVATYVPQDWNRIQVAEAGSSGYTIPQGALALVEQAATAVATTLSAGFDKITSLATHNLWIKEHLLDGIAWHLAKATISTMLQSLVNWINSGFSGRPMFVTDLKGFLQDIGEEVFNDYMQDSSLAFLCDAFRLNVQVALNIGHQQRHRDGRRTPQCTPGTVLQNLEDFVSGTQGSFLDKGGWPAWFKITNEPHIYTSLGAQLAAEGELHMRMLNAQSEATTKVNWGGGFLSGEICEIAHGSNTSKKECFISKPGKIIQEALSFNLDSGRQSLVAADEIDEVISALFSQLAAQVFKGSNGLLGLSKGTGYTTPGRTVDDLVIDSYGNINITEILEQARLVEDTLVSQMETYILNLGAIENDSSVKQADRRLATQYKVEAVMIHSNATNNFNAIITLKTDLANANQITDPTLKASALQEVFDTFTSLQGNLHKPGEFSAQLTIWNKFLQKISDATTTNNSQP